MGMSTEEYEAQKSRRFAILSFEDAAKLGVDVDSDDWGYCIVETRDGTVRMLGHDQCEPEDKTFVRDLAWVADELNRVSVESRGASSVASAGVCPDCGYAPVIALPAPGASAGDGREVSVYDMPDADYERLEQNALVAWRIAYSKWAVEADKDDADPECLTMNHLCPGDAREAYTDGYRTGYLSALESVPAAKPVESLPKFREGEMVDVYDRANDHVVDTREVMTARFRDDHYIYALKGKPGCYSEDFLRLAKPVESLAWIPVGERLPEPGAEVVAAREGFRALVRLDFTADTEHGCPYWWSVAADYALSRFTHWMLLPSPPAADNSLPAPPETGVE